MRILSNKLAVLILVTLFFSTAAMAQEAKLKAAFIYQFTRLLDWCPDGKSGDFTIGIVGNDDEIARELNALDGRNVGAQNIKVLKFASTADIISCNIVVLPNSQSSQLPQVVNKTKSMSCVLVICDKEGAINNGAGISFVSDGGKLSFEVNTEILKERKIKISQQLLRLAQNTI